MLFVNLEQTLDSRQAKDIINWLVAQPKSTWERAAKWAAAIVELRQRRDEAVEAITEKNRLMFALESPQLSSVNEGLLKPRFDAIREVADQHMQWVLTHEQWIRREEVLLIEDGVDTESWRRFLS